MTSNYQVMRSILNTYSMYRGSKLIGPAMGSPFSRQYKEFIEAGGLDYVDAVTFHHYYGPGEGQKLSFFFDPVVLDSLVPVLQRAVSLVKRTSGNKRKQVWLGETASSYNGGTAGISNSYAAGFMWMDKLGLCALNGIDAVFRHTFFMGNYAMTNDDTNPNPDYWLSLLYRTLIGEQVLNVKSNLGGEGAGPMQVRFYAHKNQTHTILFGMNLLNETVRVEVSGQSEPVTQYLLEPKEGNVTSTRVLLNGRELIFDGKRSPSVTNMGVLVTPPIEVPSKRYGMWVWRN
uniref:Uncharacterized protein n=1 Tax=Plectus sambesii TaxID=2011161 RepID=A0A914WLA0_9BILA